MYPTDPVDPGDRKDTRDTRDIEMGILFYNRQDFWEQTKFFGKRVSFRKKRMIAEQNGWLRKKKRHKEKNKTKTHKRTI